MPLVILTGYPCSGLTYRTTQLATLFNQIQDALDAPVSRSRYKIQVVPSHDSKADGGHPRTVYDTARAEKEARAVTYARIKRALSRDTIVFADGMNYIKGWRYQLWCEAKAAGTTCCVVHVGAPPDVCIANNAKRQRRTETANSTDDAPNDTNQQAEEDSSNMTDADEDPYPVDLLNNLIYRYEEPSTHSRWDRPLFTVPYMDPRPPAEDIWWSLTAIPAPKPDSGTTATASQTPLTEAALQGRNNENDKNPTQASPAAPSTLTARRSIQPRVIPHQATVQPTATDPGALQAYEKRTADVISALRAFTTKYPSIAAALASPDHAARVDGEDGLLISMTPVCETSVFIPLTVLEAAPSDDIAGAGGILALPRLQRLKRQWIGLNRAYIGGRAAGSGKTGVSVNRVADAFVRFLNDEMGNAR